MKSALNQLILLGFVCQGLSWDAYLLPGLNVLLWVVCVAGPKRPVRVPPVVECGLLTVGAAAGWFAGYLFHISTHFFVGHGITLLQAARLLRPLERRERILSLIMAWLQLAVACTFLFDLRFLLILGAGLVLFPRALIELEAGRHPAVPSSMRLRPGWLANGIIAVVMTLFFLLFPRLLIGSGIPFRSGATEQGTLLDAMLDPAGGGVANPTRILLQIQGSDIGYLRCFSLVDFDGRRWRPDRFAPLRRIDYVAPEQLAKARHRSVRVKTPAFLGRVLPTDGHVVGLEGVFFRRPLQNINGGIECEAMWTTAKNWYQYWAEPVPMPERLSRSQFERLTRYPELSPRVVQWRDHLLRGLSAPLDQARALEASLRTNCVYELGAPGLNRLNPIDDFLFVQKRGHCERFAAALTALFRSLQIPSRIVIGYVPSSQNRLSGWYNVRFSDAHAWTEAWFLNVGWVRFDATPSRDPNQAAWHWRDVLEDLDLTFSSYVVSFDRATQVQFLAQSRDTLISVARMLGSNRWIALVLFVCLLLAVIVVRRRSRASLPWVRKDKGQVWAAHFYGQMLMALAQLGHKRPSHRTPYEFLEHLRPHALPLPDIKFITEQFCASRYGQRSLSKADQDQLAAALRRIREIRNAPGSCHSRSDPAPAARHPFRRTGTPGRES